MIGTSSVMGESLFKIRIKRDWEVSAPYEWCVENNLDWTHFIHCHKKSVLKYELLNKQGDSEIFLYQARCLYPLPFSKSYIVFRKYEKEVGRYKNVYYDVKSGYKVYLDSRVIKRENSTSMYSEYLYELPNYWRYFPKLFFMIFKYRMKTYAKEDNQMFEERIKYDLENAPACGPEVPKSFNFFEQHMKKSFDDAHVKYNDHYYDNLEDAHVPLQ